MQSFRDPGGFQGAQQNFQQVRADSGRLETYRQQNSVAQTYEPHGISSKEYYNQQTYQGYGNNSAGSYFSGSKVSGQHPQGRSSNCQSGGYSRQFQSEGQPSKWGSPASSVGGLSQYVQDSFKGSVPSTTSVATYQQQHMAGGGAPPAPHAHFMQQTHHKPLMQQAYVPRPAHFNQAFQSSPSAYPTVQDYSHSSRSYEGFAQVPASSRYDQQGAATPDYSTQASYGYKAAIAKPGGYDQNKVAHVKQQNLQYHNQAKLHLLSQSPQVYYQPDAPVKSPEQFYQTFSPASTHSPVSTVVRSPSYSSTPSPLMSNPEALQFAPPSEGGSMAADIKGNVPHLLPTTAANQGSSKTQPDPSKVFLKEKIPEKLLSDGAFSSLVALSSQVENIPRTVQQLLLSNTLAPHRKITKRLPKKAELLKSAKDSLYSEEALGTPQTDLQEGDYSSSSEDQMEKMHFFQNHSANLDALRKNLDTILACSVTSPNEAAAEAKSDDSMLSGENCPKLMTDGLFGKEEVKASSVIILKDSFKERLEAELKLNHLEEDKDSKGSPLNLDSAENFFGHLICAKRSGHSLGSDCGERRGYPMGFGDESCGESHLFPARTESASLLQPLGGDCKDSPAPSLSGGLHKCCSSLISSASQDLEKLNLFDVPERRGKEPPGEWEGLEADPSQRQFLQKVQANSKEQSPSETDLAPAQFAQEVEAPGEAAERGPEDGGDGSSELGLLAAEQEVQVQETTVGPNDSTASQDHAAALAERKSVICDVSPTRPAAKEGVSPHTQGGAQRDEEAAGPSAGPRLLGHSVIHLGPAIGAEPKVEQEDPMGSELNPQGGCGRYTDHLTDEGLEPAAADTPDLPDLSSDLISSALTEIENGPIKVSASRGARVRRLVARVTQGAGPRGKEQSPPRPEDNTEHLMPTKLRCLGPQKDRAKSKPPQGGFAAAESVAHPPTRMCTRSSTALLDPDLPLQSRALLRRRMSSQREDGPREASCYCRQRPHSDPDKCLIHRPGPNVSGRTHLGSMTPSRPACTALPEQQLKGRDSLSQEPNPYKPVVLRARTRAQGMILHKDVKQRRNCDLAPSRCFTARNNSSAARTQKQLTARQEAMDYIEGEVAAERLKTRNSASRLEGAEEQRFPQSHPLKRKGYCSFPLIPAKRQHQMLKAIDTRTEKQKHSSGPPSDTKPTAPTSAEEPTQSATCGGISEHSVSKEISQSDLNCQPGLYLKTPPKTKILPPRKGRGLKLEAIVQKITSPSAKSFACSNYSGTAAPCLTLDEILSLKEEKLSEHASGEQNEGSTKDAVAKVALVDLSKKCLIASKRLKEENEHRAQEKSSPHAKTDVKVSVEPELREVGHQPTGEGREGKVTTLPDASPQLASPSSGLASSLDPGAAVEPESRRDPAEPKRLASPKRCLPPTKRRSHPAGSKVKQTKSSNTKVKRPGGRGGRRRRKHLKGGGKTAKPAHRRKKQLKRRNLPLVDRKEPVIRLKYVSYKMPRAGSKPMAFCPYVRVDKNNAVSSICTVINTLSEEQCRFQKVKKRSTAPLGPLSASKTLPTSSAMLPGPVVLDSARQGYLLCCLCGRAKNHKELGDLFGPYYPEDYVPPVTKNQHARGKFEIKNGVTETPSGLAVEPKAGNSESESPASNRANVEKAAEVEDQSPLRTSSREKCKKLSCYCCEKSAEDTELRKARRRVGTEEEPQPPELPLDPQERWLHGACAVWTSGVYLAAGKLFGLQEAVEMAIEMRCSLCEQTGATLGCYTKGCNQKYHYICAIESGCQLSEENFSMKCSKHKSILSKIL